MSGQQAILDEVLRGAKELPTLPHVIARIMRMTASAESSAADIAQLVGNDPALSSRVLRLVNSAFYGFPRKVGSVTRAIVLLGFAKVKNLAVTASVAQMFGGMRRPDEFDFRVYWEHAVATALAAEAIGKRVRPARADDAFVSGLLSELGKALLAGRAPERFRKALREAVELDISLHQAARQFLDCDLCALGGEVARVWNFPEHLVEALRFYRDPQNAAAEYRDLAHMVHLADALAGALGWMGVGQNYVTQLDGVSVQELGLDEAALKEIAAGLPGAFASASAFLELAA